MAHIESSILSRSTIFFLVIVCRYQQARTASPGARVDRRAGFRFNAVEATLSRSAALRIEPALATASRQVKVFGGISQPAGDTPAAKAGGPHALPQGTTNRAETEWLWPSRPEMTIRAPFASGASNRPVRRFGPFAASATLMVRPASWTTARTLAP